MNKRLINTWFVKRGITLEQTFPDAIRELAITYKKTIKLI